MNILRYKNQEEGVHMLYDTYLTNPTYLPIILTDLNEPEEMIIGMADIAAKKNPALFSGMSLCVFYRLRYVPPYENFNELRSLILKVKEKTGLRAEFRGIVAIEVSEWEGHETEEYFSIILKYLYDHCSNWYSSLVIKDLPHSKITKLLRCCAIYITPIIIDKRVYKDTETLSKLIQSRFVQKQCNVQNDATGLLANRLISERYIQTRSLTFVDRVVDEIIIFASKNNTVDKSVIQNYLRKSSTIISLFDGLISEKRESRDNGEETLQL